MKVLLMYPDRDFDPNRSAACFGSEVVQDLGLETVLSAMARDDRFIHSVAKGAFLTAFENDAATITHRQDVLADCLANVATIRELYALAVEVKALERKQHFWMSRDYPSSLLYNSIEVMKLFVEKLRILRDTAQRVEDRFHSAGFCNLFAMLKRELGDDYFTEITRHLEALRFRHGVQVSVGLGAGNRATGYILRRSPKDDRGWLARFFFPRSFGGLKLTISSRDEAGWRIFSGLRDRGEALAAAALARSTDHISGFFQALLTELAFYVGAIALHETLTAFGVPTARPLLESTNPAHFECRGLYDVCLALDTKRVPVGNDVSADGKTLLIVTGANQGGKSTFLRSLGQAWVLMQAGLFTPATDLRASLVAGLFTHFKREEDAGLKSGKLDEELARMSDVIDHIESNSLLLLNESFASTNEREGSEIARQITMALVESGIRIAFVTHLYEFAHAMNEADVNGALFLRADRHDDGTRTFRMVEGQPQATSWGVDLYRRIFDDDSVSSISTKEKERSA